MSWPRRDGRGEPRRVVDDARRRAADEQRAPRQAKLVHEPGAEKVPEPVRATLDEHPA